MAGFEPANEGVKVPCLTAWLHPYKGKERGIGTLFPIPLFFVGWVKGLEPSTPGTTIRCSNQLSYTHHISGITREASPQAALGKMVRQKGFEPPAYCLEGSCSIHLSYGRTLLSQWVPLWRQFCVGTGCERNNTIPIAFCQGKSEKSFNFFALRAKMTVPACRNGLTAATFRHSPAQSPVQSRTPRPAHDAPR